MKLLSVVLLAVMLMTGCDDRSAIGKASAQEDIKPVVKAEPIDQKWLKSQLDTIYQNGFEAGYVTGACSTLRLEHPDWKRPKICTAEQWNYGPKARAQ